MHKQDSQYRIVTDDVDGKRINARRQARSLLFKACLWLLAALVVWRVADAVDLPLLLIGATPLFLAFLVLSLKAVHLIIKYWD